MPVMTALSVTLPCLVAPIFAVPPTCQPLLTATLTPDNQGTVGPRNSLTFNGSGFATFPPKGHSLGIKCHHPRGQDAVDKK
ncbi:hypothetical protein EDB80DRAFT_719448 [Ilyonectria destructans]|nr:hypothetical protein EDB80DRAFT_719448 [Ilyonectria destructans]